MEIFFNASNPILLVITLTLFVLTVLYASAKKIFIPLKQKHEQEKLLLELHNEKLLTLFVTVNPNPLFRFDENGEILICNPSAKGLLKQIIDSGNNIKNLLTELKEMNLGEIIGKVETISFTSVIGKKTFSIIITGLGELKFAHAYLSDISDRIESEEKAKSSELKIREYALRLQNAGEDLKNKISMDIHDGVCQTLSSIKLRIGRLQNHIQGDEPALQLHAEIMGSTDGVLNELRNMSYQLTPKLLFEYGLVSSIQMLISQMETSNELKGSLQVLGEERRLNPKLEINLYRIVQELLSNIVRHAKAKTFTIQLIFEDERISLIINNDGPGFAVEENLKKGTLGLLDLHERVASFAGNISISSNPTSGTETIIEMPVEKNV